MPPAVVVVGAVVPAVGGVPVGSKVVDPLALVPVSVGVVVAGSEVAGGTPPVPPDPLLVAAGG